MADSVKTPCERRGLTIICAPSNDVARVAADDVATELAAHGVRFVRLVESADIAARELRRLADSTGALLASTVTTLPAWAGERWAVFGDGRTCVSADQRRAHVIATIRQAPEEGTGAGGINLLARGLVGCVEDALRQGAGSPLFETPTDEARARLNPAQAAMLGLCHAYERRICQAGLIEPGLIAALLPEAMGNSGWAHLVLQGIASLSDAQARLVAAAAQRAGVTLVLRADAPDGAEQTPARAKGDAFAARLAELCRQADVPVSWETAGAEGTPARCPEIAALASSLFRGGTGEPVTPTGAVRFVLPSGRYAEGEAVARELVHLCASGMDQRDVIVTSPDPLGLAEAVSGRLAAQRVGVLAAGSRPLALSQAYRALAGLMQLVEAARADEGATTPAPELRPLASDLARNPLLGVGTAGALRLDAQWRQRRTTCAADMLAALRTKRAYDEEAHAYKEVPTTAGGVIARLQEGDVLAALAMLEPQAGPTSEQQWERSAFAALQGLLQAASEAWSGRAPDLTADALARLAEGVSVRKTCLAVPPQDIDAQRSANVLSISPKAVRFMTLREASAQSARAVLACGLTAGSYSLAQSDDAASHLMEALGLPACPSTTDELRWQFSGAVDAVSEQLVLERALNDANAQAQRPSALFEEVVDCYRPDVTATDDLDKVTGLPKSGKLPCATLGEEAFDELVSPVGPLDRAKLPVLAPTFELGESAGSLMPPSGVLSPSSLESYMSCPARWFFERKLPHNGIDGKFGPLQIGTFCHRVLQVFHEELPGSLGVPRVTEDLLAAREAEVDALLDACFDRTVAETRAQAQDMQTRPADVMSCLVAISPLEERTLEALREKLRATVHADACFPAGFAPAHAEWGFGLRRTMPDGGVAGPSEGPVPYAGALLGGKIDRIDADANGSALIVDYKGSLSEFKPGSDDGTIPLHTQAFMYARALERSSLGLHPSGVAYLSYRTRGAAALVDKPVALRVGAKDDALSKQLACVEGPGGADFQTLLDIVEEQAAEAVGRMRAGDIAPRPRFGKLSCSCCPIASACPEKVS